MGIGDLSPRVVVWASCNPGGPSGLLRACPSRRICSGTSLQRLVAGKLEGPSPPARPGATEAGSGWSQPAHGHEQLRCRAETAQVPRLGDESAVTCMIRELLPTRRVEQQLFFRRRCWDPGEPWGVDSVNGVIKPPARIAASITS